MLLALVLGLAGCGSTAPAAPETHTAQDEAHTASSGTALGSAELSSAELTTSELTTGESSDEHARDPAWEEVPADEATDPAVVRVDSSEGEVGAGGALCSGACSAGAVCTNALGWRCECLAQRDENCGGVQRGPSPPVLAFVCRPADPDADRGDGCPFSTPRAGTRCRRSEQSCTYARGSCGDISVATCPSGRWRIEDLVAARRP